MTMEQFRVWIGLGGVDHRESARTKKVAITFDWLMLAVAFWLPVQWYLEVKQLISIQFSNISDWMVWFAFIVEATTMTLLARKKLHHWRRNWMNLFIIVVSFPLLWVHFPIVATLRAIRVVIILRLLVPWTEIGHSVLSRNHLGTTLIIMVVVTCLSGMVLSTFDAGIPDPWSGIWWAWETVTTVGYGDIVPTSTFGRFLAILIMILGLGIFSLLTANISAFLIGRDDKDEKHQQQQLLHELKQINTRLDSIEARIKTLESNKNQ